MVLLLNDRFIVGSYVLGDGVQGVGVYGALEGLIGYSGLVVDWDYGWVVIIYDDGVDLVGWFIGCE